MIITLKKRPYVCAETLANPVFKCVTPVGRLVGAAAEVDGELSNMCVCARQHREQLHEVQGPDMTVGTSMCPLLQAELGDRCLQLSGQRY